MVFFGMQSYTLVFETAVADADVNIREGNKCLENLQISLTNLCCLQQIIMDFFFNFVKMRQKHTPEKKTSHEQFKKNRMKAHTCKAVCRNTKCFFKKNLAQSLSWPISGNFWH
jgi:hypothetical protein